MGYDIKDKVILITGANRGIGRALVDGFIEHGAAKVYAAVRTLDSAAPLVEQHGEKVVPVRVDLTDPPSITAAAQLATDVDVVINNAGVLQTVSALDPKAVELMDYEMQVNVYGLMRVAQAFAPALKANGGGALVQLNSVASLRAFAGFATYCASKAAAYSITQALRESLAEQGTVVLSVHPGPIATDMGDSAGFQEIAEPPALVVDSVIEALRAGDFHTFPDSMAKQVGGVYQGFAENVIEADMSVG
ncbi:MAG: SDR family oxidoreductase [Gammaproteobacteria bacterium]